MKNFVEAIKSILMVTFLTLPLFSLGQSDKMCQGYSEFDLPLLERLIEKHKNQTDKMLLMESYFILLNTTAGLDDEDTFKKYVDEAVDLGDELMESTDTKARAAAYLSSIYGFKIAFSPMMGMFYGPKAGNYSEKAIGLDPEDPVVQLMYGVNKYNTPSAFGGDIEIAIEYLNQAIQEYETRGEQEQNWKYLHALVWLGIAYDDNGQPELAQQAYQKSLVYSPNFKWVKLMTDGEEQ